MEEKKPFSRPMMDHILGYCYFASTNDMEPDIRQRVRDIADKPYTDAELYDFLDSISKIQCDRLKDRDTGRTVLCVGYISGFVQSCCDVSKYYLRPEDGGQALALAEEVKARWKRED